MLFIGVGALALVPATLAQLAVEISTPEPFAAAFGTVVAAGTSSEANEVAVSPDGRAHGSSYGHVRSGRQAA